MERHLSLSQAARLIGVKRADIQKKIQENKLVVMEGTVVLSDLKKAFPEAHYEDNSMLEKMEKFMHEAVHKMAQSEREGSQVDTLSRRIVKINNELVIERRRAEQFEKIIDGMKQKFIELSIDNQQDYAFNEIKHWFHSAASEPLQEQETSPETRLEEQIKQFMRPLVRLLPSRHDYISEIDESLLDSALRSGLSVDYGCNNGKCGKCKAKLLTGEVTKTRPHDYVFSTAEKTQNYILTCSNTAKTDLTLETEEAVSAADIPLQTIKAKVQKIDNSNTEVLKTPRSQRLRFLAGQHIELMLNESDIHAEYSIASCPCEVSRLEFHIPRQDNSPFSHAIQQLKTNDSITLNGPSGSFILDEDSPNSLIFIAWDTGFSAIKSLVEHALSLDKAHSIHLYWMTTKVENHYMDNLCRSWNDALDNFTYTHLLCEAQSDVTAHSIMQHLHNDHSHLLNIDLYIAALGQLNQQIKPLLTAHGVKGQNMHFENVFHGHNMQD